MNAAKQLVFITVALLAFTSCSNPVKDELLNYVNVQIPKVANLETEAVAAYGLVTGDNYKDDETTYIAIRDNVAPKYRKLINGLEEISTSLQTNEVRKLNETYIEAATTQFSGFTIILAALENQDYQQMTQANEKLDKGRKLIRDFQIELKSLCNKNGVKLN